LSIKKKEKEKEIQKKRNIKSRKIDKRNLYNKPHSENQIKLSPTFGVSNDISPTFW